MMWGKCTKVAGPWLYIGRNTGEHQSSSQPWLYLLSFTDALWNICLLLNAQSAMRHLSFKSLTSFRSDFLLEHPLELPQSIKQLQFVSPLKLLEGMCEVLVISICQVPSIMPFIELILNIHCQNEWLGILEQYGLYTYVYVLYTI